MAALTLSPTVFSILSSLVEELSGLHYGVENLELFADKVTGPAMEAGFESLLDYYYFLRYDARGPEALQQLVNSLLVHETYFFREPDQLKALMDQVVLPKVNYGARLRLWCAACATGEEPLTLAMMLAEARALERVEVVASDLSQPALDRAQRGEYGPRSVRAVPPDMAERWLAVNEDRATVHSSLRDAIQWRRINLLDSKEVRALGGFDVILCRNVLIYFRDKTALDVLGTLTSTLKPGGKLAVGASESLMRFGTELECEELGGAFFYAKAGG